MVSREQRHSVVPGLRQKCDARTRSIEDRRYVTRLDELPANPQNAVPPEKKITTDHPQR